MVRDREPSKASEEVDRGWQGRPPSAIPTAGRNWVLPQPPAASCRPNLGVPLRAPEVLLPWAVLVGPNAVPGTLLAAPLQFMEKLRS